MSSTFPAGAVFTGGAAAGLAATWAAAVAASAAASTPKAASGCGTGVRPDEDTDDFLGGFEGFLRPLPLPAPALMMTCGLRVIGGLVRNWALYNTLAAQTVPLSRRCSFSHILFDAVRQIALKQYQVPALQPSHGEISHASAHIISATIGKIRAATTRYDWRHSQLPRS